MIHKKIILLALSVICSIFHVTLIAEIKIVCTAALIDEKYEMRKNEYITCMNILAQYGFTNPYIIEAIKQSGPTFLDDLSTNVFYSTVHDFKINIENKGINEARTMLQGFEHFNFDPEDMIIKVTGRYHFLSDDFFKLVKNNPDVDIFVRQSTDTPNWIPGACIAMRCKYFKEMLSSMDYDNMLYHSIYIEREVDKYVKKQCLNKDVKVVYVDKFNLKCYVYYGKLEYH